MKGVVEAKIVGMILVCLLLAWLPEKYWGWWIALFSRIRAGVRRRRKRGLVSRGYALQGLLGEGASMEGRPGQEAPDYKFYTELFSGSCNSIEPMVRL